MAQHYFSGSSDGLNLTTARTISLSGSYSAVGVINWVKAYCRFSTTNASQVSGKTISVSIYSGGQWHNGSYYITGSSDWGGEYSGHTFELPITPGSNFDINSVTSMQVSIDGNGSYIFTKGSFSVTVDYAVPTPNGPPSQVTVSASTADPGAGLTLSYPGAYSGTANSISGYQIEYQEKAAGDTDWPAGWTNVNANATATTQSVSASSSYGAQRRWRVRTKSSLGESYYSSWVNSGVVTTNTPTANGAPTSANLSATALDPGASTTLSFPGATAGSLGSISGYRIEMMERATSSSNWPTYWDEFAANHQTSSATVYASSNYGAQRKFRVKALSGLGSAYDSAWRESTSFITTNSPTANGAPTSANPDATGLDPGKTTTLRFPGATAGALGSISGYRVEMVERANTSVAWPTYWETLVESQAAATLTVYASNSYGAQRKFRAKALSGLGATYDSLWRESTKFITTTTPTKNSPPTTVSLGATALDPNETTVLTYTGASAGTINTISGYRVEYQDRSSSNASWPTYWQELVNLRTQTTLTVYAPEAYFAQRRFRVKAQSGLGETYDSDWVISSNIITSNGPLVAIAPTSLSVNPTIAEEVSTLSWSGAQSARFNGIEGIEIEYSESTNNGVSYGNWAAVTVVTTTTGSGSLSVSPGSGRGSLRKFRARTRGEAGSTYYSPWKESSNTLRKSSYPTAPTSVSFSALVFENSVVMSWSGATDGYGNTITGYRISYQTSNDGTYFGDDVVVDTGNTNTSYTLNTESMDRAKKIRFKVASIGAGGLISDYSINSAVATKNSIPLPATNVAVPAVIDPTSTDLSISFTPATDADNNITGYEIALRYPDGTWYNSTQIMGTTTGGAASPIKLNISTFNRGVSWRIAIRPYDSLGIRGEWAESAGLVKINELQAIPSILFPKQNTKTYNRRPRVGIQLGQGAEGKTFEVKLSLDSVQHTSNGQFMNEFSARGDTVASGRKLTWMLASPSAIKNVVLSSVMTNDGVADLPVVNRPASVQFAIANPNWTDPVLVKKVTSVKAVHINELRAAINNVEDYYGIAKTTWTDVLIARVTAIKAAHVEQLRAAIDAIKTFVNEFDTTNAINDIPRYSWTDQTLTNVEIKAEHIQEIRDSIMTL